MSIHRLSICQSVCQSVFSLPDDNLSKCLWIFTKPGLCIDTLESWYGIANGQISSIIELSALHMSVFSFANNKLVNTNGFSAKLGMCIDIMEIGLGIANDRIVSIFASYRPTTRHLRRLICGILSGSVLFSQACLTQYLGLLWFSSNNNNSDRG